MLLSSPPAFPFSMPSARSSSSTCSLTVHPQAPISIFFRLLSLEVLLRFQDEEWASQLFLTPCWLPDQLPCSCVVHLDSPQALLLFAFTPAFLPDSQILGNKATFPSTQANEMETSATLDMPTSRSPPILLIYMEQWLIPLLCFDATAPESQIHPFSPSPTTHTDSV